MFNFDLKKTKVFQSVKRERFPLFRFSSTLRNLSLFLFILSLALILLSFLDFTSAYVAVKIAVLFFTFFLIFQNLHFFTEFKIKRPKILINFLDAVNDLDNYNLADFLSFDASRIVSDAIDFCKKRKIPINSSALFYSTLKLNKKAVLICARLGLDAKKLQEDLKNFSEKIQKQRQGEEIFSEDFKEVLLEAVNIAKERSRSSIAEHELLVGLAKHNDFFDKVLVEFDLKEEDVENMTMWLESAEDIAEKNRKFWTYENLLRKGSLGKEWSSGYTITLDKFSTDWTKVTSSWMFREIIGHDKEVKETEIILSRSSLSNALIIGNPGTGRKSILESIAQKCYLGTTLPELNNKRVVELDIVSLSTQIQDFEKLESTLDQIFSEALAAGNVILAIDELHNFIGQEGQKAGVVDISGVLSKYLNIPHFQFVGITSYDGLHRNIEKNSTLMNFFRKVEVREITEKQTIRILQSAALEAEYRHDILILYPAIREIVNLTGRYMPSLPFPKKALDILDEAVIYVETLKEKVVFPHHISEVVSEKTEIPIGKMKSKEKQTLLNLENLIHQRIVGQEEAVKEISTALRRARSGISSNKRPMGTFLFLGPTGVGKTETSKALAQIYFGSEEKIIRIDMSEFQSVSDIPRLLGAISPVEMQGILTTPVRENPFSLVLFDEIEKAHPNILNLFLQILDEGYVNDGQGRKIIFTNTLVICTSNAGASMIFKEVETGKSIDKERLIDTLIKEQKFKPEFINRFDATVIFHPLTKDNLLKISQLFFAKLKKNLEEKEINFEITEPLKEKIVELSYKPEFGAREMRRVIQDKVENAIAQALLADKLKKTDSFKVNPENFELIINSKE